MFMAVLCLLPFLANAQAVPPIDAASKEAIHVLVNDAKATNNLLGIVLAKENFPPASWLKDDWRGWSNWTSQEQIAAAFHSANDGARLDASKGNGANFLAKVANELAQFNAAVLDEPALRNLAYKEAQFKFAFVKEAQLKTRPLPPVVRTVVERIAFHATPVHGMPSALAARCCGLAQEEVKELSRTSEKYTDFLEALLTKGKLPPQLAERLARMKGFVSEHNVAMDYDQVIRNASTEWKNGGTAGEYPPRQGKTAISPSMLTFSGKSIVMPVTLCRLRPRPNGRLRLRQVRSWTTN